MSMKHRWMEVMKRGLAPSSSPRSNDSSPHDASTSASTASSSSKDSNNPQSLGKRRSFALALPGISTLLDEADGGVERAVPPTYSSTLGVAFAHFAERCESVGACSVSKVLELCMLQGGVHHTHMNILTYLGSPLRVDTCCYVMSVQWFRARSDRDEFQLIPDACDEWFTPTADDIGAKILAKVAMQDHDAVRTKLLEYGPIKEDPDVRSKVETYLERRSVLFMGLESLAVQDGAGDHDARNNTTGLLDMRESWTLLIDDRRVRLTCESSLLPPFEGFYTSSIRVEIVRCSPHEFYLYLADNCFVHLRAASHTVRDIIALTLRAFCRSAVSSELINQAIAKGQSPMLTIRTLAAAEEEQQSSQQQQQQQDDHDQQPPGKATPVPVRSPPAFSLPWNQVTVGAGAILIDEDDDSEEDGTDRSSFETGGLPRRRSASESLSVTSTDFYNDSVLQDAEALIGNAMTMGLQNHLLLPRAPKRISVAEIADLQIIEAMEADSNDSDGNVRVARRRPRPASNHGDSRSRSSSLEVQAMSESLHSGAGDASDAGDDPGASVVVPDKTDASGTLDDALRDFQHSDFAELEALRSQYVAIFCAMQRELSESKTRCKELSERLEATAEENRAFRKDIGTLQDALSSVQFADVVRAVVTKDVQQKVTAKTKPAPRKLKPAAVTAEGELFF